MLSMRAMSIRKRMGTVVVRARTTVLKAGQDAGLQEMKEAGVLDALCNRHKETAVLLKKGTERTGAVLDSHLLKSVPMKSAATRRWYLAQPSASCERKSESTRKRLT